MSGWKEIESAPKDGTKIMVWANGYEWPEIVFYELYSEEDAEEIGEPGYWRHAEDLLAEICENAGDSEWSHWRQLPDPPKM